MDEYIRGASAFLPWNLGYYTFVKSCLLWKGLFVSAFQQQKVDRGHLVFCSFIWLKFRSNDNTVDKGSAHFLSLWHPWRVWWANGITKVIRQCSDGDKETEVLPHHQENGTGLLQWPHRTTVFAAAPVQLTLSPWAFWWFRTLYWLKSFVWHHCSGMLCSS